MASKQTNEQKKVVKANNLVQGDESESIPNVQVYYIRLSHPLSQPHCGYIMTPWAYLCSTYASSICWPKLSDELFF